MIFLPILEKKVKIIKMKSKNQYKLATKILMKLIKRRIKIYKIRHQLKIKIWMKMRMKKSRYKQKILKYKKIRSLYKILMINAKMSLLKNLKL